jgi:ribonuclease HII
LKPNYHKKLKEIVKYKLASSFTPNLIEAGVDEVGRGCLAGPVVAGAVILPKDYYHSKLTDSKQLTKKERDLMKIEIEKEAICFAIAEVSNQKIDEINIHNASILAMHRALNQLSVKPEMVLVDGKYFHPYPFTQHQCFIKGDSRFLAIAAASVLAKCHRDNLMEQFAIVYPFYDWEKNAGYPTKKHRKGIELHGISPHHRQTYKLL